MGQRGQRRPWTHERRRVHRQSIEEVLWELRVYGNLVWQRFSITVFVSLFKENKNDISNLEYVFPHIRTKRTCVMWVDASWHSPLYCAPHMHIDCSRPATAQRKVGMLFSWPPEDFIRMGLWSCGIIVTLSCFYLRQSIEPWTYRTFFLKK